MRMHSTRELIKLKLLLYRLCNNCYSCLLGMLCYIFIKLYRAHIFKLIILT